MDKRILIDTDPAINIPLSDINDGLTLFLALNSPELNAEGITTFFENSSLEKVTRVAKVILMVANLKDIQLYRNTFSAYCFFFLMC